MPSLTEQPCLGRQSKLYYKAHATKLTTIAASGAWPDWKTCNEISEVMWYVNTSTYEPDQAVNPLKDCWCCLGSYTHCRRCTETNWFIIADPGHLGWWAKWSAMGVGVKHGRSITYHQSSLSVVNMQPKLSRWVYLAVDSKLVRSRFYQPYAFREYLESFKYFLNLWLVVGHRARVLMKVVSHPLRAETLLSSPRAREEKGKAFCPALLPKCLALRCSIHIW